MSFPKHSLAFVLLWLVALPAAAALYKWTDAQGTVQYGQFPPPGVQAQEIHVPSTRHAGRQHSAPAPAATAARPAAPPAESPELARQRAENCHTARYNLAILQRNAHVRIRLPDGGYRVLDAEERQQRIHDLQDQIDRFCRDVPEE